MKISVLSDLHIDIHPYTVALAPDAAVVVIAGDVCERLDKSLPWMAEQVRARGHEVIYVPGNHDHYGNRAFGHTSTIDGDLPRARELAAELGMHLLAEGEAVVIGGARFVGATLWTDYEVGGDAKLAMSTADQKIGGMNDHRRIKLQSSGYGRFRPVDALAAHRKQLDRLAWHLAQPFDGPTVVVTHHAPHPRSLRESKVTETIDASYASDLTEFIERWRPALWIHGHVHKNRDYRVADTRIVSNPRGYVITRGRGKNATVEVENPAHQPDLAIDVPMGHRIDPLGRDTSDLPAMVAEIVDDRESGRTDAAIRAEIDAVEERWGLKPR
ncbi:metallophosphoesterase [Hansschlegelia sp. KR7-227]|uniref:metallophosphoesterase n=1 Tax=Hansschlegelia sp. KR7-227 TaxID=3400914 RepID=UPI003BFB336C